MHLNDEWAGHAVANIAHSSSPDPSPKYAYAILVRDLPVYRKIASTLSGMECRVYDLLYADKVGSKRDVARLLNKPTRDITKYCQRIDRKLARCWVKITPIRVGLPDSDSDDESNAGDPESLSRRNCSPQAAVRQKRGQFVSVLPVGERQAE